MPPLSESPIPAADDDPDVTIYVDRVLVRWMEAESLDRSLVSLELDPDYDDGDVRLVVQCAFHQVHVTGPGLSTCYFAVQGAKLRIVLKSGVVGGTTEGSTLPLLVERTEEWNRKGKLALEPKISAGEGPSEMSATVGRAELARGSKIRTRVLFTFC